MSGVSPAIVIVAFLLSLVATILAFIFIIPEKRRATLNGFGKFLHDLCNFKFLIIEKILQFCYVLLTAWILLQGFFTLFQTIDYGWGETRWIGYMGLVYIILGPVAIRIVYELLMMAILAIKNIIQINNKLKNQNEDTDDASPFAAPVVNDYTNTPTAPVTHSFCTKCGSIIGADGKCINPDCDQ